MKDATRRGGGHDGDTEKRRQENGLKGTGDRKEFGLKGPLE